MYQISALLQFPELVHGFSTIQEGNMSYGFVGKEPIRAEVTRTRRDFLSSLGIPFKSCVSMRLQHADEIMTVDGTGGKSMEEYELTPHVDGLLTDKKNLFLFLAVADCLPIILYDPKREAIGLIHAGWKGTDAKIAAKAVVGMIEEFGCNPKDLVVGIGPAIHKDSYVKRNPEMKDRKEWQPFLLEVGPGDYAIDFVGYNLAQLKETGVKAENIFVSDVDTGKNLDFFSHYRGVRSQNGDEGRFACVAGTVVI